MLMWSTTGCSLSLVPAAAESETLGGFTLEMESLLCASHHLSSWLRIHRLISFPSLNEYTILVT